MKVAEGIEKLSLAVKEAGVNQNMAIEVFRPGMNLGGTPCVKVKGIVRGFDWNSGKVLIEPEKPLMTVENARKQHQALIEALEKVAHQADREIGEIVADGLEGSVTISALQTIARTARDAIIEHGGRL